MHQMRFDGCLVGIVLVKLLFLVLEIDFEKVADEDDGTDNTDYT